MLDRYLYEIAITQIDRVGPVTAKNLIAYCGGAEAVLRKPKKELKKIPNIGEKTIEVILESRDNALERAKLELEQLDKHNIKFLSFYDDNFPEKLKNEPDSPIILYYKGNKEVFSKNKVLGVVGTRKATDYGKKATEEIINNLANISNLSIISGLAFGIDIAAHKASLDNKIPTIAVLAHGLDQVYPTLHKKYADKMLEQGGALISEFPIGTIPDKDLFPARNRIVAGLASGLLVVETLVKGGAMITAKIAYSYNREVMAVPGKVSDLYSSGCNYLIKSNIATLVENATDIKRCMNWDTKGNYIPKQQSLFASRDYSKYQGNKKEIINVLQGNNKPTEFDVITYKTNINPSILSLEILELELEGIIQTLPGKFYKLI
jgi:DNA processing protein